LPENAKTLAGYLFSVAREDNNICMDNVGDSKESENLGHDALIVGAPIWHTRANLECSGTSWDEWRYIQETSQTLPCWIRRLPLFLRSATAQESYSDNFFCKAEGELYNLFNAKGCKVFGFASQDGYNHQESKDIVNIEHTWTIDDTPSLHSLRATHASDKCDPRLLDILIDGLHSWFSTTIIDSKQYPRSYHKLI
jgi:flavodoxin I